MLFFGFNTAKGQLLRIFVREGCELLLSPSLVCPALYQLCRAASAPHTQPGPELLHPAS